MTYQHTQTGHLAFIVFLMVTVVLVAILPWSEGSTVGLLVIVAFLVVVGVVLANFNRLTVTVDDDVIDLRFRWGWPHKRIARGEVHNVTEVRNKWWYGFGVRLTPYGWLYNVWGLDAVQLDLTTGGSVRIGTDQPADLAAALRSP